MEFYKIEEIDDAMVHSYTIFQIREAVGRSQMFFKVEVLKNFVRKSLLNEVAGLERTAALLK